MDTILYLLFGIALGSFLFYFVFQKYTLVKRNQLTEKQSTVLLDKMRSVFNLITVEGDFTEIYHYEDVKERFLSLLTSKKKALIIVDAKAHVGFDLSKIVINSDPKNKKMTLKQFPQPKLLTVETNYRYYDKKDGYFNKFDASDLTELNKEAKQQIIDKIPESGLLEAAKKEALNTILLVESLVDTIGWKLDYTALEVSEKEAKILEPAVKI